MEASTHKTKSYVEAVKRAVARQESLEHIFGPGESNEGNKWAWYMQNESITRRQCKHLREI